MGRPLVANRTAWVVSRRPHLLDKLHAATSERAAAPGRPARSAQPTPADRPRPVTCGDPGASRGTCWNGSPLPAGPGRHATSRQPSRCGSSSSPRTTRPCVAEQQSVRAYPRPYGVNARPRPRLPQPDHRRTSSTQAEKDARHLGQRRLGRSAAPASRRSTTTSCAACPATSGWPSTRWAGCSATTARSSATPGDTLVTSIDAKVQGVVERAAARRDHDRARDRTTR